MSVDGALERLAQALRAAPAVPLSASCVVHRAELLALVEQVRTELPAELDEAHELLRHRETVMTKAHAEADALLTAAHRRADKLVAGDAVIARAQARAQTIVDAAAAEAATTQQQTDDWCDRSLAGLEAELSRLLTQVQRGRGVLADRVQASSAAAGAAEAETETVVDLRDGRPPSRWTRLRRPPEAELGASRDLQ